MPHTALDVVTASLKRLGVLAGIETASADLAADGLDRLNSMLESWRTESLLIYAQARVVTPMTVGKAVYTIGTGGDIAQPRPLWLAQGQVAVLWPGSPASETPLTALSRDEWQAQKAKALTSTFPDRFHYNANAPLGELYPWPALSGGVVSLVLYLPIPLPDTLALTTLLDLPPGYYRAVRDNLAMELAPELGRQIDPMLLTIAVESKAAIKRVNTEHHLLRVDPALLWDDGGRYNWQLDE